MVKDFLGNELFVGDIVVFVQLNYRSLCKGVVTKITPKMLMIEHNPSNYGVKETRQFHDQVVKVATI